MEPNIKIRPAAITDVDTVYHFICHLEEMAFDREKFAEKFKQNMNRPENIYMVAVNETEEVIAFMGCQGQSVLHQEGRIFEIQELYVARPFRNKGIGKALLAALGEKLNRMNCAQIEISMHAKKADARRFYSKLGFQANHIKMIKEN